MSRPRWPGSSGWSPKRRRRRRARALADRAATFLFYFALGAGVLTFEAWSLLGSVDEAVTVLVIACPHALGLAIPLVIAISTERAARAGVLVKDRLARERMRTGVQPGRGPLAVGVLAFAGVVLSPAAAAVMMSASTVVEAANAQLLRRLDLDPARLELRCARAGRGVRLYPCTRHRSEASC